MAMNLEHASARRLVKDLETTGVKLPKEVREAIDTLNAVETAKPAGGPFDIAAAFLDGDAERAAELALARAAKGYLAEGHTEAVRRASAAITQAVTGNAVDLLKQLKALAAPLIADLTTAAGITADLTTLVREGRTADARIIADVDITAATLASLYAIRDRITPRADYGAALGVDCGTYRDPGKIPLAIRTQTPATFMRGAITAGAGLWFPTPAEAQARAAELRADADRARAATEGAQRQRVAVA